MKHRFAQMETEINLFFIRVSSVAKFFSFVSIVCYGLGGAVAAPPKVNRARPAGCQRGQSVVATAAGAFSTWPVQVWAAWEGVSLEAEKDKDNLKAEVPWSG